MKEFMSWSLYGVATVALFLGVAVMSRWLAINTGTERIECTAPVLHLQSLHEEFKPDYSLGWRFLGDQ